MKSAFQKLALWLGLAVVAVLIPVLHFILVPAFIAVGFWMASRELKKTHFISDHSVPCEKCQATVDFSGAIDSNLLRKNCPSCKVQICVDLGFLVQN